ncbi:hypothetical protein EMIT0194P_20157 [Pseudomonas serbica]
MTTLVSQYAVLVSLPATLRLRSQIGLGQIWYLCSAIHLYQALREQLLDRLCALAITNKGFQFP